MLIKAGVKAACNYLASGIYNELQDISRYQDKDHNQPKS